MGEMAKKISKLECEKLLQILNTAYAEEWLAYYQYWIGAKVIKGHMRPEIQTEFEEHANEELKHAAWLAERIIQLGGTPILSPDEWKSAAKCQYLPPKNPLNTVLLQQNLESERCAIARYQQICEMTMEKDFETFEIARKILHEELDHEQDWEDFLSDLNDCK